MTSWRATYPLHDLPETRGAWDTFWSAVRARLLEAGAAGLPEALTPTGDAPDDAPLAFGQAWGASVGSMGATPIALPEYRAEGSEGARVRPVLVIPRVETASSLAGMRGCTAALDATGSDAGHAVLQRLVAPVSRNGTFFASIVTTGSPMASLEHVAAARADLAVVDGVTLSLAARHRPDTLERVRRLMGAELIPAAPFVSALVAVPPAAYAAILDAVARSPEQAAFREATLVEGFTAVPPGAFAIYADLLRESTDDGYPTLR